jgi:hypothetical protein
MLCLLAESRRAAAAAGLLCGIGVALKLTAALFAVPLLLMLMVLPGQRRASRLVLFGLSAAAGFLAAYGWWGWLLWRRFGNPFYPMFGALFPSASAMPITGQDTRFLPQTLWQWLAYPFFWLQGKAFVVSELKLREPRFALAYLATAAAIAACPLRRPSRQTLALWLFMISGYIIWLCGFSILRYALPLEVLTGVFIASVLQTIWPARRMTLPLALLAIFCLAVTKPMGWGRIGYGQALVAAPVPRVPAGTLLLTFAGPAGFVLPYLTPAPAHIIGLGYLRGGTPEWVTVTKLLAQHPPIWLLTTARRTQPRAIAIWLAPLGLTLSGNGCLPVHSAVQKSIELCPLSPASGAGPS